MAATLKDLQLQLQSERTHFGFGQEPAEPRHRNQDATMALFVIKHLRAPENEAELEAFRKAREADGSDTD